jgi:formylglycine-generating enzyme required for sulfatase activity
MNGNGFSRSTTNIVLAVLCACLRLSNFSCFAAGPLKGPAYTNSIGMKFVRIEPGTFRMGQPDEDLPPGVVHDGFDFLVQGDYDEKPRHRVTISRPFYMAATEVTNFRYELFDPSHRNLRGKFGLSKDDDEAAVFVSWYEAAAFCKWLSDTEGMPYRLPTEAEWEYAARAGTTTNFSTGDTLPQVYHNRPHRTHGPAHALIHAAKTPPNPWGLYDMHGNVEEWCLDWYGPYPGSRQKDPVGYESGQFRVTRGGSYNTRLFYLRSANRSAALPEARNWLVGFRPVIGEIPKTRPLAGPEPEPYRRNVVDRPEQVVLRGPDPAKPHFRGPLPYVKTPTDAIGPVFASHNHNAGVAECPNGDLLAAWFSTVTEGCREVAQAGSRLRWQSGEWDRASAFWDVPDRNDTAPALWYDGDRTVYHITASSFAASSHRVMAVRTSTDSGATWSSDRVVLAEYVQGHTPGGTVFAMNDGAIAVTVDWQGSALWISRDKALTWYVPEGRIAGVHGAAAQLADGGIIALGRGGDIDGRMPLSVSADGGETFEYSASGLPPIGGAQKAVLLRLAEGPLFAASFADHGMEIVDASGTKRKVRGLYTAVSYDNGLTWPHRRLVTAAGPPRVIETTDGAAVVLSDSNAEFRGYLTACQARNGVVHLLSSRNHYAFNFKWLTTPQPAVSQGPLSVRSEKETFSGPRRFDLAGWHPYHGYRGRFNGTGGYTIESLSPVCGLNRIIGKGSFEMEAGIENIEFYPALNPGVGGLRVIVKNDRLRSVTLQLKPDRLLLGAKDLEPGFAPPRKKGGPVELETVPKSLRARFVYDEAARRLRVFYGLDGSEPTVEHPESAAGITFGRPFTESTAAYLTITNGRMDLEHYSVKAAGPRPSAAPFAAKAAKGFKVQGSK